eukprot:CAMPEP_0182539856 /NCGR_PEP_ID=MMETSP1323-20130603/26095_1 /TAXON_ID=236787 /ORGANISM="Florenciella parvula, Strain RCC1693" /LENGTH=85 /DNA_ID=CAMNT_0024750461 /DNA_START=772 /DNA_END=1026 /DNA_ORIENTATION=+
MRPCLSSAVEARLLPEVQRPIRVPSEAHEAKCDLDRLVDPPTPDPQALQQHLPAQMPHRVLLIGAKRPSTRAEQAGRGVPLAAAR